MRKLRLDLDELAVESFSTLAQGKASRGTVRGRADTEEYTCGGCTITENGCQDYTVFCSYGDTGGCTCPNEVGEG